MALRLSLSILGTAIPWTSTFSATKPLDPAQLVPALPFLADAIVTQREPNTFSGIVDRGGEGELSFFGLPGLPRLSPPLVAPDNGLRIASLLDLAGTEASVVQVRAEAKDDIDIDALLQDGRIDLPLALAAAQARGTNTRRATHSSTR